MWHCNSCRRCCCARRWRSHVPLDRDNCEIIARAVAAFAAGEARLDLGEPGLAGQVMARALVGAAGDEGGELLRPQPADMPATSAAHLDDVPLAQIGEAGAAGRAGQDRACRRARLRQIGRRIGLLSSLPVLPGARLPRTGRPGSVAHHKNKKRTQTTLRQGACRRRVARLLRHFVAGPARSTGGRTGIGIGGFNKTALYQRVEVWVPDVCPGGIDPAGAGSEREATGLRERRRRGPCLPPALGAKRRW